MCHTRGPSLTSPELNREMEISAEEKRERWGEVKRCLFLGKLYLSVVRVQLIKWEWHGGTVTVTC